MYIYITMVSLSSIKNPAQRIKSARKVAVFWITAVILIVLAAIALAAQNKVGGISAATNGALIAQLVLGALLMAYAAFNMFQVVRPV